MNALRATGWPRARGVSLIEALVALAVMAFGILGVVGVQSTLRQNADVSRQRAEAVRIAQEAIENWRAFTALPTTAGQTAYADIVSGAAVSVDPAIANTSFAVTRSVADLQASDPAEPRLRHLVVNVAWTDRIGQTQHVVLDSSIAGIAPELAGSLAIPGGTAATSLPGGRNPAIPIGAVDQGDGTSLFAPPGGGVTWTFDNVSAVITRVCNPACIDTSAFLLSGYVRFATSNTAPTPADAENPTSPALPSVALSVAITVPSATTVTCFEQGFTQYVAYYCAIPTTTSAPARWSGRSTLGGPVIAATLADDEASHFKVCRYTPGRSEDANGDGVADGDKPLNGNLDHPLDYVNVTGALRNQNFLVIRAGNDSVPFDCPGDDPATPLIDGNTWRHQPHS
jgi:Tfp pilus assembly protein PilV